VTSAIAQETRGTPCRLILNCWWEQFDVRSFLQANLPERTWPSRAPWILPPPAKVLSLVEMIRSKGSAEAARTVEKIF